MLVPLTLPSAALVRTAGWQNPPPQSRDERRRRPRRRDRPRAERRRECTASRLEKPTSAAVGLRGTGRRRKPSPSYSGDAGYHGPGSTYRAQHLRARDCDGTRLRGLRARKPLLGRQTPGVMTSRPRPMADGRA